MGKYCGLCKKHFIDFDAHVTSNHHCKSLERYFELSRKGYQIEFPDYHGERECEICGKGYIDYDKHSNSKFHKEALHMVTSLQNKGLLEKCV